MIPGDQTIQAIDRILNARSVAVVGASNDPSKFGYMTVDSILQGGFEGNIFPINPKGGKILNLEVYSCVFYLHNIDFAVDKCCHSTDDDRSA